MKEQDYWEIIETVGKSSDYRLESYKRLLHDELATKSQEEIEAFDRISFSLFSAAYRWEMVGAARALAGFCSDDNLTDFIGWLISRGRSVYYLAVNDPLSLREFKNNKEIESFFFEEFLAIPSLVAGRELNSDWQFPDLGGSEVTYEW